MCSPDYDTEILHLVTGIIRGCQKYTAAVLILQCHVIVPMFLTIHPVKNIRGRYTPGT